MKKICEYCGTEIVVLKKWQQKKRFCSNKCSAKTRKMSAETKTKISNSLKGNRNASGGKGRISPMKGKKHSKEIREKISEAITGKKYPNRKEMSIETKMKISKTLTGRKKSLKVRRKMREAQIKRVEKYKLNGEQLVPNYNLKACKWFSKFDLLNNTNGQYATNSGERRCCGYFLDYINDDLKLIIEWDENHHFTNGKLREKDIFRENETKKEYKEYAFWHIKMEV